ncbi:bifunctional UDP-N-acetylglucosamine pyrophosphorylase/glucosamine-1-phosphate N-acetyltransferase [Rhodoligotrophos appendicifer]|uniref:bifunctional UDP-N-acetylglucosamine diphosphorylase/glucosamine-1-phosphate N-acetyltransferase GlmU n=1 Tax=Rhodoligotrophos appendicifer TaxID=987056 RepID=UPI0011851588|nr:bifunctional UDP-N-acetylglucosamine diphosphorylase/glucosamine-1-phosphate N-acetyltransferase GlmU [Rhodoligotrophos appendicifer]
MDHIMLPITCIVLAAGKGTRMRSGLPKVMHRIAGRPLVGHVLASVAAAGATQAALVVGPEMDDVAVEAGLAGVPCRVAVQCDRLGTAHAASIGLSALSDGQGTVIVLFGDTPLVRAKTINELAMSIREGAKLVVLGFEAIDPAGYGRILQGSDGRVLAIREDKDASPEEKQISLCNSGVMAFDSDALRTLLPQIGTNNAKGEYYLTDAVGLAVSLGWSVEAKICAEEEVLGINNRVELSRAEAILQARLREAAMIAGATLVAPETVFFSTDTKLGQDVLVEPHVVFGPGVTVRDRAVIHSFSHIEGAVVGEGAAIGPFARLRPGTDLGEKARVGNFVEIKNSRVAQGAKINHLTYVGDTRIGAGSNIGAGTITCNYDGFDKFTTEIGAGVFIGSNSALVAPVSIGDGAYVGTGSVITEDVPANALALGRGRQVSKLGWATAFRDKKKSAKTAKPAAK